MAVIVGMKTGTSPSYWLENTDMLETAIDVLHEWSAPNG